MNRLWVIRMCDLFLGIPSLLLDRDPTSKDRRKLYGGAGSHRIRNKYGVEYRSLSNFWVSRPSLVELIYNLATVAVRIVMVDKINEHIWNNEINPDKMRTTINNMDIGNVDKFMVVVAKYVGPELMTRIYNEATKPYTGDLSAWE